MQGWRWADSQSFSLHITPFAVVSTLEYDDTEPNQIITNFITAM